MRIRKTSAALLGMLAFISANASDARDVNLTAVEVVERLPFFSSNVKTEENLKNVSKDKTIAEALKSNPNLSLDLKQSKGINAGGIAPQDFSVNGAAYYQNSFTLDGASFNNDFSPRKTTSNNHNNIWADNSVGSQAMTLDTDMLESLELIDSDVSAKYGGFQGGVVNARTRDPRRNFGGILSTSYSSGDWAKIYKDDAARNRYDNGNLADMSDFKKHRYRLGLEGYVSENFGLLFDYTRATSKIVNNYNRTQINQNLYSFPDDLQKNENYFLKGVWRASDRLVLRPSILYSKLTNDTSAKRYLDSRLKLLYGGYKLGLEASLELDGLTVEQNLAYSFSQSSRDYAQSSEYYNYQTSNLKNWGTGATSGIGGYNDFNQEQKNTEYSLDAALSEFNALNFSHNVKFGLNYLSQRGIYEIPHEYNWYGRPLPLPPATICPPGDKTCVNDDSFSGAGQFLSQNQRYYALKNRSSMDTISLYLEDEARSGRVTIRPGARFERNSANGDFNVAPRFVASYEAWDKNFIGLGANRYFGRNFFAYKIYNGIYKWRRTGNRTTYPSDFTYGGLADERYPIKKLKTPHTDEISLFYKGEISGAKLGLKYVRREGKNEVAQTYIRETLPGYGNGYYVYTNDGKSKADVYTLTLSNAAPVLIGAAKNDFSAALTYTKQSRNFKDFTDDGIDDDVIYDGKIIKKGELPVVDYHVPFSAKFTHSANFGRFSLYNFVNFTSRTDALISSWNRALRMDVYRRVKLPSFTTWDMKIGCEQPIKGGFKAFANLDINNVLNKKYKVNAQSDHYEYGLGRNFWLEVGVKW